MSEVNPDCELGSINTSGSTVINGGVNTQGGDFIGHDLIIYGNVTNNTINNITQQLLNPEDETNTWVGVGPFIENFWGDYQAYFGGRDQEMRELDAWLAQSATPIAMKIAPAGRGKSAIVSNWTKRIIDKGSAYVVFYPISLRYGTNSLNDVLSSLITQLLNIVSPSPDRRLSRIEKWNLKGSMAQLNQLLCTSSQLDKPLVVVIDGLDELNVNVDTHEDRTQLFSDELSVLKLPGKLADGVHLLVTARGDDQADQDFWCSRLQWDKTSVRFFGLEKLSLSGISYLAQQYKLPIDRETTDQLIQQIYRLSEEGDPLVASLWLNLLKSKTETLTTSTEAIDALKLETQRPGIDSYTQGILSELKQRGFTSQTLFELLCIARGPIAETDLAALNVDIGHITPHDLTRFTGRLIICHPDTISSQMTFVLGNSRIGDAYRQNHLSPVQKKQWIKQFWAYGDTTLHQLQAQYRHGEQLRASHYLLHHYSGHLRYDESTPSQELFALIDEAWMQAHYQLLGTHEGFLRDVDNAWIVAIKLGCQEITHGNSSVSTLDIQMKAAQCLASIVSMAQQYPPTLPALLVYVNVWTHKQAQNHISHIPDPLQRIRAYLAVLKHQKAHLATRQVEELVSQVLSDLDLMATPDNEELRCRLMLAVFEYVTQDFQIRRATAQSRNIHSSGWRVRLLASLLGKYPGGDSQIELLSEILQQCSQLNYLNSFNDQHFAPYVLQTICQNLPAGILSIALTSAFDIAQLSDDWEHHRDEAKEREEIIDRRSRILHLLAPHIQQMHADEYLATYVEKLPWRYPYSPESVILLLASKLSQHGITIAANLLLQTEYDSVFDGNPYEIRTSPISRSPTVALLALAHYCHPNQAVIKAEIIAKIAKLSGKTPPENKLGRTACMLIQYVRGNTTDEELAAQFYADTIRMDQVDDYPVFALLGPSSMKAVIEQWSKYHDLGRGGQRMRTSPYFLEHVVERVHDEDLHLALAFARQDDFHDFEMWSYYRALTRLGDRLPPGHFYEIEESLVDSVLRNDAGYDATVKLIQRIAPRLKTKHAHKLISRLSEHGYWQYRLLRESLISSLNPDVIEHLTSQYLFDYQTYQSQNQGQLLAELALYLPKKSAAPIAETLHQYTKQVLDLPKRFELLESLHMRNQKQTHHWQREIRKQALQEMQQVDLPVKYKLDILKFLPLYKRLRIIYQLLSRSVVQQQFSHKPKQHIFALFALWDALIDSIALRRIIYVLLVPVTVMAVRFMLFPNNGRHLAALWQKVSSRLFAKRSQEAMKNPSSNLGYPESIDEDWYDRCGIRPSSQKDQTYSKYWRTCKDFVKRIPSQITEGVFGVYVKLNGWCLEVPQTTHIMQILSLFVQQLVEDERNALVQTLTGDQQIQLPDISSMLQKNLDTDIEIDRSVLNEIFHQLDWPFGSVAHRIALRKRGVNLWDHLPNDKFDLALDATFSSDDPDDWTTGILTLLPSLATRRPDLLSRLKTKVEEVSYWHFRFLVISSLAYYLPEEQKTMIVFALDRASQHREEAQHYLGMIWEEVVDYADDGLLPWIAEQLVNFHQSPSLSYDRSYFSALKRMASRIKNNMGLLDIIWPLVSKMSPSQRKEFFLIIASTLDTNYLAKLLSELFKEEDSDNFTSVYFALRDRWLELPSKDAYIVWTTVLPDLGRQSRHKFFGTMLMFSKIILKLGSPKAIVKIGDDILEVSHWRWF